MAHTIRQGQVLVPAGTPISAGFKQAITFAPLEIARIEVRVPPGPRGEVGFAIGAGGVAVFPFDTGQFIVADDEEIGWDLEDTLDAGSWQVLAYNTGQYDHTLWFRFLGTEPQLRQVQPGGQPIPNDQLTAGASTNGSAGQAVAPVPIVPPPPPEVLPPGAPVPPGELPVPDVPPPQVPAPPGQQGPAAPGQDTEEGMAVPSLIVFNGQLHAFRVNQQGQLIQDYFDPHTRQWGAAMLGSGLPAGAAVRSIEIQGQLHVFVSNAADHLEHFWFDPNAPQWRRESLT